MQALQTKPEGDGDLHGCSNIQISFSNFGRPVEIKMGAEDRRVRKVESIPLGGAEQWVQGGSPIGGRV